MTFEPAPSQPTWAKVMRATLVFASIVLAGFVVVGGASFLGRTVGGAVGTDEVSGGPIDVEPGLPVTVEVPMGSSGQDIGAILTANGVVRSALEFELAVRNVDAAQRLKAGTYEFTTLMDPAEVVAALVSGPVASVYRVTVIEGLRVEEMLAALAERTGYDFGDFSDALLGGEVTTSLRDMPGEPALSDWEGLLFPDTYEFSRTARPEAILQRLASTMEQRVNSIDWSDWEDKGYTRYEGIVIASLIESEVRVPEERPVVSSVLHNRLAIPMRLDIDATVLYALGTRDVSRFDREVASPYNTYRNDGLPPTPISAPSRASLEAAAAPDETPYLFYVLKDLDGSHAFAETLDQHNRNVDQSRRDGVLP